MDCSEKEGDAIIVWENPDTPPRADDYIFMHGKRMVRPYYFEFVAHVKRRWAGKSIVDLYAHEFKGRSREYYVQAVESGRICVEGMRVAPSFVLRDSQKMSHFVHRHEPPVMAEHVKILEESPDVITVCKPPSIPVHPCGQYRKNTVISILEAEHSTGQLFPIHRLDRLVSGLLILARNAQAANLFRIEIEAGRVHKEYVAKVKGVFPAHKVEVNSAVVYDAREGISRVETGQLGVDKSKAACTRFRRLSTNGICSIVCCEPVTGRTHQIRVHLQHLGYPIANDDLYLQAHPPKRSREGVSADTAAKAARTVSPACSVGCLGSSVGGFQTPASKEMLGGLLAPSETEKLEVDRVIGDICCKKDAEPAEEIIHKGSIKDVSSDERGSQQIEGNGQFSVDMLCTHCPNLGPSGYERDEDGLWLHCVRYSSPSWSYECPLPNWAL